VKWKDDVKQDLKIMIAYNWKKQAESRNEWKQIFEQAKTHRVLAAIEEEEEE
jgi:hypothetical protein